MSDELTGVIIDDTMEKMGSSVSYARSEFATVRTGRASSSLVERMIVEAYGVEMKLQELASFSVPEARQLLINPHDPANVEAIERSIQQSDLGLSPSNDGKTIRLSFPPLTEERRHELVRVVKSMAEDGKIKIRNLRRSARKELEDLEKDGDLSSDDLARANKRLDDLTHASENGIDEALNSKEEELLEV
jgi:ribosome recycling factor